MNSLPKCLHHWKYTDNGPTIISNERRGVLINTRCSYCGWSRSVTYAADREVLNEHFIPPEYSVWTAKKGEKPQIIIVFANKEAAFAHCDELDDSYVTIGGERIYWGAKNF